MGIAMVVMFTPSLLPCCCCQDDRQVHQVFCPSRLRIVVSKMRNRVYCLVWHSMPSFDCDRRSVWQLIVVCPSSRKSTIVRVFCCGTEVKACSSGTTITSLALALGCGKVLEFGLACMQGAEKSVSIVEDTESVDRTLLCGNEEHSSWFHGDVVRYKEVVRR
jgi:hypothetical protein